ncbi:hypothetical protein B0533_08665 [Sedimentibacter sp. SX930]|nr:hypothetical protein B0533_08665 [Sedimentibacter sp. SX930]
MSLICVVTYRVTTTVRGIEGDVLLFAGLKTVANPKQSSSACFRNILFMNEAYASGDGLDPQVILFGDSHFQFLRAIPTKENILEQSRSYSASQTAIQCSTWNIVSPFVFLLLKSAKFEPLTASAFLLEVFTHDLGWFVLTGI